MVPAAFAHNSAIAALGAPGLLVLLAFGRWPAMVITIFGGIVTYTADASDLREITVVAALGTIIAVVVALWVAARDMLWHSLWNVLLMHQVTAFMAMVCLWCGLQFKWLAREIPAVAVVAERVLFACLPMPGAIVFCWGAASVLGLHLVPVVMLAYLSTAFFLCSLPRMSSFASASSPGVGGGGGPVGGGAASPTGEAERVAAAAARTPALLVCGPLTMATHAAMLFLPAAFYAVLHSAHLALGDVDQWCMLGMLACAPVLLVRALRPQGSLWFLELPAGSPLGMWEHLVTGTAVFLGGTCFQVRVVLHAFQQYVALPAPWSHVCLCVTTYSGCSLLLLHLSGLRIRNVYFGAATVGAISAGLLVGVPKLLLPVLAVVAWSAVQYYWTASLRLYFAFAGGGLFLLGWFALRSFWFLRFHFSAAPVAFLESLQPFCILLGGLAAVALVIPGLGEFGHAACTGDAVPQRPARWATGAASVAIVLHAAGVTVAEQLLFEERPRLGWDLYPMYPSYLVLATSATGAWLALHLFFAGSISRRVAWALVSVYVAKVVMLFTPSTALIFGTIGLLAAILSPFLLYELASPAADPSTAAAAPSAVWRARQPGISVAGGTRDAAAMSPPRAAAHLVLVTSLSALVVGLPGGLVDIVTGSVASPGAVSSGGRLGCACLVPAMTWVRMVDLHFPHSSWGRRCSTLSLLAAGLLSVLGPELGVSALASSMWNTFILGRDLRGVMLPDGTVVAAPAWTTWALVVATVALLSAATAVFPIAQSWKHRGLFALCVGGGGALYLCGISLPPILAIYAMHMVSFTALAALVTFAAYPTPTSPALMVPLVVTFLGFLPVIGLAEAVALHLLPRHGGQDDLAVARTTLLAAYGMLSAALAIYLKARKVRWKRPGAASGRRDQGAAPGLAWVAPCGNLSTVVAFSTSLVLGTHLLGYGDATVLVVAPLLLLLHPQPGSSTWTGSLSHSNRYGPVFGAATGYLLLSSASYVVALSDGVVLVHKHSAPRRSVL